MSWIDKSLAAKATAIPKKGFNVVLVDTFEPAGDAVPVVVAHFETAEEAGAERARLERDNGKSCTRYYVYGPTSYGCGTRTGLLDSVRVDQCAGSLVIRDPV